MTLIPYAPTTMLDETADAVPGAAVALLMATCSPPQISSVAPTVRPGTATVVLASATVAAIVVT
jgi:hypothetical protein